MALILVAARLATTRSKLARAGEERDALRLRAEEVPPLQAELADVRARLEMSESREGAPAR